MQRVERHIVKHNEEMEALCYKAARLYNFCNYHKRMIFRKEVQPFGEYELTGLLAEYNQQDYRALPAQTAQQVVKQLFKDWKAFFKSLKDYKKTPAKYKGKPKPPCYKDKQGFTKASFTSQQVKLKDGYIHFPKDALLSPVKTKVAKVDQVRIVPGGTCFIVEVVYTKPEPTIKDWKNILMIDIGLNNLVTAVSNVGAENMLSFICNGRIIKAVNHFYNKVKAKLQSYIGGKGISNRIRILMHKRNMFIHDYLHKTSRLILNYCMRHQIGTIVIGKNKEWKQEINIGKRNNQSFTSIPHDKLITQIMYKAEEIGIKVMNTEESYTSKCDNLALETMEKQETYLGKRVKRGLFRSSTGALINADVNGAIGIGRKVFGDAIVCQIQQLLGNGFALSPVRINPLINHPVLIG